MTLLGCNNVSILSATFVVFFIISIQQHFFSWKGGLYKNVKCLFVPNITMVGMFSQQKISFSFRSMSPKKD